MSQFQINEQQGYAPDVSEWVSNTRYVPRNLIAVVTRNVSDDQADGESFAASIKAVLEVHPILICGLWTGFSASGMFMPDPAFRMPEKYGRPIDRLLMKWRYDYDCYRRVACVADGKEVPTVEQCTVDVMFIEPDPTFTKVVQAWHGIRMFPEEYSGIHSKRDLMPPGSLPMFPGFKLRRRVKPVISEFTLGYEHFEYGFSVDAEAQRILDELNVQAANPHVRTPFVTRIADDILEQARRM